MMDSVDSVKKGSGLKGYKNEAWDETLTETYAQLD